MLIKRRFPVIFANLVGVHIEVLLMVGKDERKLNEQIIHQFRQGYFEICQTDILVNAGGELHPFCRGDGLDDNPCLRSRIDGDGKPYPQDTGLRQFFSGDRDGVDAAVLRWLAVLRIPICRLRCGNAQDICNQLLVRLLMRLILKHQIQIAMRQVPDCFTEIVRLTVVKPLMNCIG